MSTLATVGPQMDHPWDLIGRPCSPHVPSGQSTAPYVDIPPANSGGEEKFVGAQGEQMNVYVEHGLVSLDVFDYGDLANVTFWPEGARQVAYALLDKADALELAHQREELLFQRGMEFIQAIVNPQSD